MKNLKIKLYNFFKIGWPFILILLIVSFFFWKVFIKKFIPLPADFVVGVYFPWLDYIWGGYEAGVPVKNPITTDVVSFMYPMQTFSASLIKNFQLPLWNSNILTGVPLLANFQSAPFSFVNIFYFIFSDTTSWTMQIILQHILCAIFTYFLLRRWQVSKYGSFIGGVAFAFCGYSLIWSQWNGHTLSASFIPLLILLTDKFLTRPRVIDGFFISVVTFIMFLSGYPQTAVYIFFAILALWILKLKFSKRFFLTSLFLGIFFIIGAGLSSVQILPGYELLNQSQRVIEPHPYEWAFLPYKKIITFIAPDYFGNHATKNYWGPQDYTSNTGFVGVVILSLGLLSLGKLKKRKEIQYAFILVLISLILSFPTILSIFFWKSGIFGLNAASAHRALVLFCLGFAILSGFGYDALIKNTKLRLFSLFIPFVLLLGFALYAFQISQTVGLRNLVVPAATFFGSFFIFFLPKFKPILIFLILFELFYFGWKFTPFSPKIFVFPDTPVISFLKNIEKPNRVVANKVIPINFLMNYGVETVEGYDAVYPLRISKLLAAINGRRSGTDPLGRYGTVDDETSRVLDLLNAKYLVIKKEKEKYYLDYPKFKKVFEDKSVVILENIKALPRAFFVCNWEVETNEAKIIDKLISDDFDYSSRIILEEQIDFERCQKNQSEIKYVKYNNDTSLIEVNSKNDGLLFLSDSYFPGWKVYVDGREEKILRANFAFRAVKIPKGNHEVVFIYKPNSLSMGVKVSVASIIFLSLFSIFLKRYTKDNYDK